MHIQDSFPSLYYQNQNDRIISTSTENDVYVARPLHSLGEMTKVKGAGSLRADNLVRGLHPRGSELSDLMAGDDTGRTKPGKKETEQARKAGTRKRLFRKNSTYTAAGQ